MADDVSKAAHDVRGALQSPRGNGHMRCATPHEDIRHETLLIPSTLTLSSLGTPRVRSTRGGMPVLSPC